MIIVICGHIHQPQKRMVETEKGKVMYLNSGDWVEHMTSLEFYQNDWHIYTYDENQFANVKAGDDNPVFKCCDRRSELLCELSGCLN